MKIIVLILVCLPMISWAQNKPALKKPLPLIESITSDTINGKYKEIIFTYDQANRVISVADINYTIKDPGSNQSDQHLADTTNSIQKFEYSGNNKQPLLRRVITYDYDKRESVDSMAETKMVWHTDQLQYFIYTNEKRVRDSIIHKENNLQNGFEWDYDTTQRVNTAVLKQNNSTVLRNYDLSKPGNPPLIYKDLIQYNANIGKASYELFYASNRSSGTYFVFTKFDDALNPLQQLNIASILSNEKIEIGDGSSSYVWHYLNKNNPAIYTITRSETDSPFKDIVSMTYTYNQFKQPVNCNILVRILFDSDGKEDRRYRTHVTFRYKNS